MTKIVAFDLETTGLDPRKDQIIEMAAVVFDRDDTSTPVDELPHFQTLVKHKRYWGQAYALQMNAEILLALHDGGGQFLEFAMDDLENFLLDQCGEEFRCGEKLPYPLGFNVGKFDMAFIRNEECELFHHRAIELGSLLSQDGIPMSGKEAINKYLGRDVAHRALQDCRDAVELFRKFRQIRSGEMELP